MKELNQQKNAKKFLKITNLETKSVYYFYQNSIFNITKSKPFGDDREYIYIESINGKHVEFNVLKVKIEETDDMSDIVLQEKCNR